MPVASPDDRVNAFKRSLKDARHAQRSAALRAHALSRKIVHNYMNSLPIAGLVVDLVAVMDLGKLATRRLEDLMRGK